jgi:hypothetical protein
MCKFMGWSLEQLHAVPIEVYDELMQMIQDEATKD